MVSVTSRAAGSSLGSAAARADDAIMGTNNSSIVSKRSVERLYFPDEPHFFRYFVKKPQRRSPLINRGYWLRMKAIDNTVRQFLEQPTQSRKVVINLGCGYDPLVWQCLSRYPGACKNVLFVDVDYKELMLKKRDMVTRTTELQQVLTNVQVLEGDILLQSDQYIQIGCDLRDLERLNKVLSSDIDVQESQILLVAEVSITYMEAKYADDVIRWAGSLPREKYPTTSAQRRRFESLGWVDVSVGNLWSLFSSPDFLCPEERKALDVIEPFDEWEEFALFGCHYVLVVANNHIAPGAAVGLSETKPSAAPFAAPFSPFSPMEVQFSESPKGCGCRRFAAYLPLKNTDRALASVGNFGGMGLKTRIDSYDVYTTAPGDFQDARQSEGYSSQSSPSSRMCHSITDLGDVSLLVGGRTGPDNSLKDCWLYHKWLDLWERVDDLPQPLYRHQAVNIGQGSVLISNGRLNSREISTDYLLWNRQSGWVKCSIGGDNRPPTYGATLIIFDKGPYASGILAGGISSGCVIIQGICK
ncbi:tRNA wybutosine-synthesizing protein [Lachnellula suecica]|uniref:tRNA wybutosine-synthesizing protein 4 n=1 Tax=Lachnellula suecica TaxID=602035 RepID=A0A8T9CGQ3_9HELO|nr:tRNA wybutosine-synthesizing protein [Lachnellula suecica]